MCRSHKLSFIRINPMFFIVVLITYLLGILKEFTIMFITLFLHETGHLISVFFCDIEISFIKIEPFGMTIRMKENFFKNPEKEIMVALSGPLMNFILAALFYKLNRNYYSFFITGNLFMGLFNLLPLFPLDGGRILKGILQRKSGYIKSYNQVIKLSKILSFILLFMGIYILIKTRFNFSLLIIGCFLFFNVFTEKNHSYFYLAKEIAEYKEKNKNIEKIPMINIGINKNFKVRKILSELTLNKYYVFNIIENGSIIKTFTESELIKALTDKGAFIKISDLL